MAETPDNPQVAIIGDLRRADIETLLGRFGIALCLRDTAHIPGSYWGAPEAGIIGHTVHARHDTPVHSLLHEACHIICMSPGRRASLTGNAGGDDLEESAVCYLQIVLADCLPGFGKDCCMRDMDTWGYSFRSGASRCWFEEDAADARAWLECRRLLDRDALPTFLLRTA